MFEIAILRNELGANKTSDKDHHKQEKMSSNLNCEVLILVLVPTVAEYLIKSTEFKSTQYKYLSTSLLTCLHT